MINILFRTFKQVRRIATAKPIQIMILFISLVLYSATGYMNFELQQNPQLQWGDAFWWSIVTMTTVGYGDLFPVTFMGRLFVGFPTMLLGVGILGYVLSIVTSAMLESRILETKGMKKVIITDHIIICNFVSSDKIMKLIQEIIKDARGKDAQIVIIDDEIEELPPDILDDNIYFVKGDPSHEAILTKANIANCSSVIVQATPSDSEHSDNDNLRVVLMIETLNSDVYTIVECIDPQNEIFFRRANCDSVVCLAALSGQMLVQEMQDPGVASIVAELTSNERGKQFYLVDVNVQEYNNYGELSTRYSDGTSLLLGIRRDHENYTLPSADFSLSAGDRGILIAANRP